MKVKLIKSFDVQDCKHYEWVTVQGCCGRSHQAGMCTILYQGLLDSKTCSRKMPWCQYQPKERELCPSQT